MEARGRREPTPTTRNAPLEIEQVRQERFALFLLAAIVVIVVAPIPPVVRAIAVVATAVLTVVAMTYAKAPTLSVAATTVRRFGWFRWPGLWKRGR